MSDWEHQHYNNVVKFAPRVRRAAPTPLTSPAAIMAEAFLRKLGDTDLTNFAVQSAVDGVLKGLEHQWKAEAAALVSAQLLAENTALRVEIARHDVGAAT